MVLLASVTLIRLYTNVPATPVGAATVTELPAVVVTDWATPPLMLYEKVYGAVPVAPVKVISGAVAF